MGQTNGRVPTGLSRATRLALGLIGTLLLVALVNDAFALGLVGQYSKQVMVALGATAFVALYRAGVFARAAGASADEGSNKRAKPRHQALLLGVIWCFAIGLVLVVTLGPRYLRGEPVSIWHWMTVLALLAAAVWIWHRERKRQS